VDEASMMGNRVALQLLSAAEAKKARVLLVGDAEQLPSIEAGRVFRLLSERGMAVATMDQVLRQRDPKLKAAVLQTIAHAPEASAALLEDRIQTIPNRAKRLQAVADAYLDAGPARADTLVLTPSNEDRVELNARIRQGLRADGVLQGPEHAAQILVGRGLTKAQTRDSAYYAVGDHVRFNSRAKSLGIDSGEGFQVIAIDRAANQVTLKAETDGRSVLWHPHFHKNVEASRFEERRIAAGDRIRWTRNETLLGRRNGEYAEVLSVRGRPDRPGAGGAGRPGARAEALPRHRPALGPRLRRDRPRGPGPDPRSRPGPRRHQPAPAHRTRAVVREHQPRAGRVDGLHR